MLFLSLLFLLFSIYGLINGRLFHKFQLENAKYTVKHKKGEIKDIPSEHIVKGLFFFGYAVVMLILQIILVINAIKIDPLLYPTLAFIVVMFINFIVAQKSSKADLDTEIGIAQYLSKAARKRSFKGLVFGILNVAYFTYLFAVLLGLV
ncbi:hypothetical protein [Cytobacillus gottheilii]|uniref:hypothetical protein n=1 Tax=Cytobacillus gottheilii TaxID=859144 RepID=UPI0009BAE76E|nr:hypothetical protein [Cytobacillus gottheilii]